MLVHHKVAGKPSLFTLRHGSCEPLQVDAREPKQRKSVLRNPRRFQLARNWLQHGVYGISANGHFYPSDVRMPGYPGFLATIYSVAGTGRSAVFVATGVLNAGIAAKLSIAAGETVRTRFTIAALWLAALCPFTANYVAVPLTEVPTIFLTTLALLIFLLPSVYQFDQIPRSALFRSARSWFFGGFVVGLGTLFRPETPLLVVAVLSVYWLRWWRPVHWKKLAGSIASVPY